MNTTSSERLAAVVATLLLWQCRAVDENVVAVVAAPIEVTRPSSFDSVIQPILLSRCVACHGAEKSKGGLRLDTRAGLLEGGDSGALFVGGDPATSELLRRIRLPLDDPDHMPPDDKPQPSELEVRALEAWIAAGASFDAAIDGLTPIEPAFALEVIPAADPRALAALREQFVHVQAVDGASNGLWIDFAAVATRVDDTLATRLLSPVREQIVQLSLARSRVGATTLELLATASHLRRLDLRGCAIDDAALAKLSRAPVLEELVLARTSVSDASVETILKMPALRRLFLWKSAVSEAGIARLRARAQLWVDAGDVPDAAVAAVEPPPKFTSDAAIPGAPLPGDPEAAVNATCPVTGSPVNPKFTVRHEGRVIGFCCPNCPAEFQKNPNAYPVKDP